MQFSFNPLAYDIETYCKLKIIQENLDNIQMCWMQGHLDGQQYLLYIAGQTNQLIPILNMEDYAKFKNSVMSIYSNNPEILNLLGFNNR